MKCIRSCLLVILLLEGCAANDGLGTDTAAQINIGHLACLEVGMSEQEALNVMHKPYSRRRFEIDGAVFDVWFYVTESTMLGQTRMVPRNLTPLTFKNGELIGWGYREYNYLLKRQRDLERNPLPAAPVLIEPAIEENSEPEENLKHLSPTMAKSIPSSMQTAQNSGIQPSQPSPPSGSPKQAPTGQGSSNEALPQQGTSKTPAKATQPSQPAPQQKAAQPSGQPAPQQKAAQPSGQPAPQQKAAQPSGQPAPQQNAVKPAAPVPSSEVNEPASSKGTSKKPTKGGKGGKGTMGPPSEQPPTWGPIDHSEKTGEPPGAPGQQGKQPGGQPGGTGPSGSSSSQKKGQTSLLSMSAKPQNGNASSKPASSGVKPNQASQPKDKKPLIDEEDRRMLEEQSEQNFNQS